MFFRQETARTSDARFERENRLGVEFWRSVQRGLGAIANLCERRELIEFEYRRDSFFVFVEKVVRPLLTTPRNHEDWPEVVSADLQRHVSDLQSQLQVVTSLVKGKILLPYPKYSASPSSNGTTQANGHSTGADGALSSHRK